MTSRFTAMFCATAAAATAAAAFSVPAAAAAEDTVKIAYIDPLSGGGASDRRGRPQDLPVSRRRDQRQGRHPRQEVRDRPLDNKINPQESLVQVQKAIDAGVRYITQGNGSSVAAALVGLRRQVQRAQSRQGSAVLQLRRGRPGADQREVQLLAFPLGRQLRHEDGGADHLHEERSRTSRRST